MVIQGRLGTEPSCTALALKSDPAILADTRLEARELVRGWLFAAFASVYAVYVVLTFSNTAMPLAARGSLALISLGLAVSSAIAWRTPRWRNTPALVVASTGGMVLIAASSWVQGWGMNGPLVGFLAVLSFMMGATVSTGLGLGLGLTGAALLVALAAAEHAGWIAGAAVLADLPLPRRLVNQLIILGVALAGGRFVHRVFEHYLVAGREREQRFQGLLGIAANTYWELDAKFTETHIWYRDKDNRFQPSARVLKAPWDQPEWEFDQGIAETHFVDLRSRRPFRNVQVRWRMPDGSLRHQLISGEPRLDDAGRFLGYWGVTRDVSADVGLQQAMQATEQRYRELFEMSPMALVIHRDWRVQDANAAALAMFGYGDVEAMKGTDQLASLGPAEQDIARARLPTCRRASACSRSPTGQRCATGGA